MRQFVEMAAARLLGIKLRFEGTGVEEKGIVVSVTGHDAPGVKPGNVIIAVDPRYFRPAEVETLSVTRPKRTKNWAGNRKSPSERWCLKWWLMTLKRRKNTLC